MTKSALLRHPLTVIGALMATVSAVAFIALAIALLMGMFHRNPYAGLVVFVAIPAVFILRSICGPCRQSAEMIVTSEYFDACPGNWRAPN